ncbi:hypothetical protein SOVF_056810 [Spinacia oleracea]|uniref:Uncharacterized protein n=1 Tax=Spinacia oleracea TaxID=3562 RepID=A0A9R0JC28_SPIOL|nr:uncharacterized protein LOC110804026 [Spinacia oleracea]KNA19947.1 hypothetical protein SOVF_056810 [Spinacia oleracea]
MGRVKGKGKKQTVFTAKDDVENAKGENIEASKRRGRPQKSLKEEVGDEEFEKIVNFDENANSSITSRSSKGEITAMNGTKRKRPSQVKENSDTAEVENGSEANSSTEGFVKSVGFRQNGSRRKSKPHRAAEVGVKCK